MPLTTRIPCSSWIFIGIKLQEGCICSWLMLREYQMTSFAHNCMPASSVTQFDQLFVTPGTVAHQGPLSLVFSRQEYWSGLPFPPPGDLPNLGIKLTSLAFSWIDRQILYHWPTWKVLARFGRTMVKRGSLEYLSFTAGRFFTCWVIGEAHFSPISS